MRTTRICIILFGIFVIASLAASPPDPANATPSDKPQPKDTNVPSPPAMDGISGVKTVVFTEDFTLTDMTSKGGGVLIGLRRHPDGGTGRPYRCMSPTIELKATRPVELSTSGNRIEFDTLVRNTHPHLMEWKSITGIRLAEPGTYKACMYFEVVGPVGANWLPEFHMYTDYVRAMSEYASSPHLPRPGQALPMRVVGKCGPIVTRTPNEAVFVAGKVKSVVDGLIASDVRGVKLDESGINTIVITATTMVCEKDRSSNKQPA